MTLKKEFIQSLQDAGMSVRYEENTNNVHIADGLVIPFEKFLITVDSLGAIPGLEVYKDANGKLAWKWGRDANGYQVVHLGTAGVDQSTNWYRGLYNQIYNNMDGHDTEGASLYTSTGFLDVIRWRTDNLTGSGNSADQALATKHATYATEAELISFGCVPVDDTNIIAPTITFQDEDNATVEGCDSAIVCNAFVFDLTNSKIGGSTHTAFSRGVRGKTVAGNKGLEVDIAGLQAGIDWTLDYRWRYVAA